jgi:hypothetical protein
MPNLKTDNLAKKRGLGGVRLLTKKENEIVILRFSIRLCQIFLKNVFGEKKKQAYNEDNGTLMMRI